MYKSKKIIILLFLASFLVFYLVPYFKVSAQTCNPKALKPTKYGQKGTVVKNLQSCLIEAGYNIPGGANGYYGKQTRNAVKKFYADWYGAWGGNRFSPKGVIKLKEKLLAKTKNLNIVSEEKKEEIKTSEKIRKFNIDYDYIKNFFLSSNAQYVKVTYKKDRKDYVQINDNIYEPYDNSVYFSNDGSKYGWTFKKDDNYYIQINDKTYEPYDNSINNLIFSNDGSKYGFEFVKDYKYYVQINDKTYGPYDGPYDAYDFTFSNDNSKYGWLFKKDNKFYFQINDKIYGPYDDAKFTFTKDNKTYIAYISGHDLVIEEVE